MRRDLFTIPSEFAGWPVFGFGLFFGIWLVVVLVAAVVLARRYGFSSDTWINLGVLLLIGLVAAFALPRMAGNASGLPVRGFGVMLLLAMGGGLWLAMRRALQMRVDPEVIMALFMWLVVAGIVGARTFYVVQKWDEFGGDTLGAKLRALFTVWEGGLVVYGSVIGAGLALFVFSRRHKLPALALCDLIAPALLFGSAVGRIGCFFNGCCYGGICTEPPASHWAVTFPWQSPPYIRQVQDGLIDVHGLYLEDGPTPDSPPRVRELLPGSLADRAGLKVGDAIEAINQRRITGDPRGDSPRDVALRAMLFPVKIERLQDGGETRLVFAPTDSLEIVVAGSDLPKQIVVAPPFPRSRPVHPTQIYSSIDSLLLCLFLWFYYPFRRRDGEVIAWLITIYPIARFFVEAIRTDELPVRIGAFDTHLSIAQNLSVALLLVAIGLWFYLSRQPRVTVLGNAPLHLAA